MAIRHILDLSTDHLPHEWRDNPVAAPGVTAYPVDYGTLLWVPDDPDESATAFTDETVPENLLAIQRHARRLHCDYVLFDPDADRVDGLPAYSEPTEQETTMAQTNQPVSVDVPAELAPLGVLLWPVADPKYAPSYTLAEVARIPGGLVRWTYESGKTRRFRVGERVACQIQPSPSEQETRS